jgi:hypothetical protein
MVKSIRRRRKALPGETTRQAKLSKPMRDCRHDLNSFLQLCNRIGIPIKAEKTVYPTTVITIYGIEIDSNNMECRLPVDKIVKIRNALNKTYNRKKIKLRDLQSLIGLLNFACLVVSPGRAFLRRLIDLTIKVFNPFQQN